MLKKSLMIALAIPVYMQATNITTLLNALEKRPEYRLDLLEVEKSSLGIRSAKDKIKPKIDLFAGYETYSSPNGLLPIAPNTMMDMVKDQQIAQPFSKHIFKEGASFSWPIFVKSVYTLEEKARLLHLASRDKQRLNLIQREAVVVGSVAQMHYLASLKSALRAKKRSINQTAVTTRLKVKEGRAPESTLFVLQSHINDLDIAMNNIDQSINLLASQIETLTGLPVQGVISLRQKHAVKKGEIFALQPLKKRVAASQKGVQAAKEAYYPTVVTQGNYAFSQADAYNNGKSVEESFGMAGVYVNIPLYDASRNTASQQAKVSYLKEKTTLEQTAHSLKVQAKQLERGISLIKRSVLLAKKSVTEQQKLLRIAKVSFVNQRMTEEEYLRYEDALADAKAALYKAEAQLWQDKAQLAVIYGNDLRRIVK